MAPPNDYAHSSGLLKSSKTQNQDDLIMGTNNSSIVSKRSVERLYLANEQHFFRYFVRKPQRRSPLINRGYWLRMKAIDFCCRNFLEKPSNTRKVIINLGCGYDPLPWQCFSRYPSSCKNVVFVDVDYPDLMARKRETVDNTPELKTMLPGVDLLPEGDVFLRSDKYLQIGCDLRDINCLSKTLVSALDITNCSVLLVAEVSITYMDASYSNELIKWAGTLPTAQFCLLEQQIPDGVDHPFAKTMIEHFQKLNTPLKAVQQYPTENAQLLRFQELGWASVEVRNLWRLWGSPDFLSPAERQSLDAIEPFDEWEEFALFGLHYFLLVANTGNNTEPSNSQLLDGKSACLKGANHHNISPPSQRIEVAFSANPKGLGHRRFAAGMSLGGADRTRSRFGNLAGMGVKTRTDTYDVFDAVANQETEIQSVSYGTLPHPSRMCHTITELGDVGALLIGGRTSPDNALSDCWLYHKWLDTWERVDDLGWPLYRHQVVNLGHGFALVSTGRIDSRRISNEYLVWSRRWGFVSCELGGHKPQHTYGCVFGASNIQVFTDPSQPRCGILAGGIAEDGLIQQNVWQWELRLFTSKNPVLRFQLLTELQREDELYIARFGASTVNHQGETYVIGGIVSDSILSIADEVCAFGHAESSARLTNCILHMRGATPRPLFIGQTVVSTDTSLLIMGGSAVCFSFGTFWNKGCFTLSREIPGKSPTALSQASGPPFETWSYRQTIASPTLSNCFKNITTAIPTLYKVPRNKISSSEDFHKILAAGTPVVLEGSNIGSCVEKWTTSYLKDKVGVDTDVIVHQGSKTHLDFKMKNFTYETKSFGDFLDSIENGGKLYMRSLSSENAKEIPTHLEKDFPSLAADFALPKELDFVLQNLHSSPLRISGPVIMWLHYDVMANVLCQVQGSKRLLLFPPSDVLHLGFEPGASSSSLNVFECLEDASLAATHPHEALLQQGDILFLPSLWLHTAFPTSGMSIAVNLFFRDLQAGYAAGKDLYGNRDIQAYEKGRQDINKVAKSFENFPISLRSFYLQRLAAELHQKSPA